MSDLMPDKFIPADFAYDDQLNMYDMNSLNAIAGLLRCKGYHSAAEVLTRIQIKATKLLKEHEKCSRL